MQRLNVKLLLILFVAFIAVASSVVVVHGIQMNHHMDGLPARAEEVKETDPAAALDMLARYHQHNRDDVDHYTDYAMLAADCVEKQPSRAGYNAATEALTELVHSYEHDPEKHQKVIDRLIKLNMNLGQFAPALDDLLKEKDSGRGNAASDMSIVQCQIALGKTIDAIGQLEMIVGYDKESRKFDVDKATAPHELDAYNSLAKLLRERATDAQVEDRLELADKVVDQLVAVNPDKSKAFLIQAQYCKQYNQTDRVKPAVEKAVALDPDNADVLLEAAELSIQTELTAKSTDFPASEQTIAKGIKLYPKDYRFYRVWVMLAELEKKPDETAKRLDEALKQLPDSKPLLEMEFLREVQNKDWDTARLTLKKFTRSPINRPDWNAYCEFLEAKLLFAQGEYLLASQRLEHARPSLGRQDLNRQADVMLMQCYNAMGKPDMAVQKAIQVPNTIQAELGLIMALAAEGKNAEAISHYERISSTLQTISENPAARKMAAMIMQLQIGQQMTRAMEERDWAKIDASLQKMQKQGLVAEPTSSLLQLEILTRKDEKEKAAALVQQLLTQYPKDLTVLNAAALLAIQNGKVDEALRLIDSAPEEMRNQPILIACRMEALLRSGKPLETIKQELASFAANAEKLPKESTDDKARICTSLGAAYMRLGDRQSALEQWTKTAELLPRDTKIRLTLFDQARLSLDLPKMKEIQSWFAKEYPDDAAQNKLLEAAVTLSTVQDALRAKSTNSQQVALDDADKRSLANAKNLLLEVSTLRPNWVEQPKLMAEVDLMNNDLDDAIAEFREVIDLGQPTPDVVKRMVTLMHLRHRDEEARQALDTYGWLVTNDSDILKMRADIYVAAGDWNKALDLLKDKFKDDSKSPNEHLLHGNLLARAGKKADAELEFRKAVEYGPDLPETWLALIHQLMVNQKTNDALQTVQDAQIKLPEDQRNLTLARAYELLGDAGQAETFYLSALSAAPNDLSLLRQVTAFYLSLDKADQIAKADKYLNQILESTAAQPADTENIAWAHRTKAKMLAAKGDYPSFEKAMKLLPSSPDNSNVDDLVTRIQLLFDRGDPNSSRQALQLLEKLKQMRPLTNTERMMLARLYERVDNVSAARQEMLDLVGQADADQTVYIAFIEMLLRHDDPVEAATQLQTYQSKWPEVTLPVALLWARTTSQQGRGSQAAAALMKLLPAERPLPREKWPILHALAGYYDRAGFHPGYLAQIGQTDQVEKLLREEAGYESEQTLALVSWLAQRGKLDQVLSFVDQNWKNMAPPQVLQFCTIAVRQSPTPPTPEQIQRIEQWFERVRRDDPDSLAVQMMYADFLDFQRRFDEVEKLYRTILARKDLPDPDRGAVLNNLSFLLAMQGRNQDEAVKLIDQAMSLFGPQSDVLDTRGVVYLSKGDTQQAVADLSDAVIATEPKPIQFVHLAMAQTAANDLVNARKSLDRAKSLNFNPDDLSPLEKSRYETMLKQLNLSST